MEEDAIPVCVHARAPVCVCVCVLGGGGDQDANLCTVTFASI